MSNYMYRLEVPAGKMRFSVAEALEATTSAIYPASAAQQPVMVVSLGKEPYPRDGKFGGIEAKSELDEDDWRVLRRIWHGMEGPKFPMPLDKWQGYVNAFNKSSRKPKAWRLSAVKRDPAFNAGFGRRAAELDHRDVLKRAVDSGTVTVRFALTNRPSPGFVGDDASLLMSRADMKAFCDLLAIELFDAPGNNALARSGLVTEGKHEPAPEHWKMRVQAEAAKEWKRLRAMNCNPTRTSIRPHLLKWCRENNVKTTPANVNPSDGYLRVHVLSGKHWTPPAD